MRGDVILASNTSSLSITELAVHTKRPDQVVGMHFFNPAPVLKLVEVVRTVVTDPDVIDTVIDRLTTLIQQVDPLGAILVALLPYPHRHPGTVAHDGPAGRT